MQGNFVMLQKEDLREVIIELLGEIRGSQKLEEQTVSEEEYYTRDQACEHLHISATKLWRMEKDGRIAAYKIGRRSLYSKKAVDNLIKSSAGFSND